MKRFLNTITVTAIALSSCGIASSGNQTQDGQVGSELKTPNLFNGAVCGTVTSRPDYGLDENPVRLLAEGEKTHRFVNLEGSAFTKVVELLNAKEKVICINAHWADESIPTADTFQLISVPDFHGPEAGEALAASKKVKDGKYEIAQCLSPANSDLGGHSTFNLAIHVKNGAITRVSAPALEFAPSIEGKYVNSSSFVDNRGKEVFEIQIENGKMDDGEIRSISEISLRVTESSVSIVFPVNGTDDVHFSSINPENCTFKNLKLFKDLPAAR